MKKHTTLLFLLLVTTLNYAQTTKPTIEETVQYIKMELEEKRMFTSHYTDNEDRRPWINRYKNYTNLNMTSCILKMTEENIKMGMGLGDYETNSVKVEKFIDFSKVESITFYTENESNNGSEYYYLSFNSKTENNKMENIKIAIGLYGKGSDMSSLKLYKAFQHLRKLCGAPEPISFD